MPVSHNPNPFSVWMRLSSGAKMSVLSLLPNFGFLYLFKCLLAEPASLSPPRNPAGSCLLAHRLLTSLPASLAGFKSLKNTSVTLTYSPLEQARRLSVDLSGGHRSGKLQRGKIRELSLAGICVRRISRRWASDCDVFDLWMAACMCIFQLSFIQGMSAHTSCSFPETLAFFLTFMPWYIMDVSNFGVHLLWSLLFKSIDISAGLHECLTPKASP